MKVEEIEGITAADSEKLNTAGVGSVETLLEMGRKRTGREKLAQATGISDKRILAWVNHADLMRIKGVGSEYSDLLEAAGVDSCLELSHRVPSHLLKKMDEVNRKKSLVHRLPTEHEVEQWVTEAGSMPKAVEH